MPGPDPEPGRSGRPTILPGPGPGFGEGLVTFPGKVVGFPPTFPGSVVGFPPTFPGKVVGFPAPPPVDGLPSPAVGGLGRLTFDGSWFDGRFGMEGVDGLVLGRAPDGLKFPPIFPVDGRLTGCVGREVFGIEGRAVL